MAPIKSSLARSAAKLLGVSKDSDLSLRGGVQISRLSEFSASGGNVDGLEPGNGYIYHTFTSPGTFVISGFTKSVEVLVVAGGGGGAADDGGGGGAGGVRNISSLTLPTGSYTITVGPGGTGAPHPSTATNGGDSSIGTLVVATGGGRGGGSESVSPANQPGANGGSGGGGCGGGTERGGGSAVTSPDGISPTAQGNSGGGGAGNGGGGGGGAGGAGGPGSNSYGGVGLQFPAYTGSLIGVPALSPLSGYFAGGGGGSRNGPAVGGSGGGGNGAATGPGGGGNGSAGTTNSGGGGGGGGDLNGDGGNGGSGIVVIRYTP